MTTSNAVAIRAHALTKRYEIYTRPLDILIEAFTGRPRGREFVALEEVSFDVRHGEVLGIVGRNGAGKSTLLKLVVGTLSPSDGTVAVDGRVSAILELGAGFHPEQTGIDNIIVGGLCLGLSRQELDRKLDWIIDFSELASFIQQPLKTYSTGMRARLAFAVAAALDPDILIIDEALSVGDLRFQQKCFRHIEGIKARGATILFVSHDTMAVTAISDRAILLEQGRLVLDSDPVTVTKHYHQMLFEQEIAASRGEEALGLPVEAAQPDVPTAVEGEAAALPAETSGTPPLVVSSEPIGTPDQAAVAIQERRYGQGDVRITGLSLVDARGNPTGAVGVGEPFGIELAIVANQDVAHFYIGFRITTRYGQDAYGSSTYLHGKSFRMASGETAQATIRCEGHLAPGEYFITASLALDHNLMFDRRVDALHFRVIGDVAAYGTSIANLNADIAFGGERPIAAVPNAAKGS